MEGRQTIAVDLDGTIASYDGYKGAEEIGDPIPGAKEFMALLCKKYKVLVFTCRVSVEFNPGYTGDHLKGIIVNWFQRHNIPYHEIYVGQGKPLASAYVDDRAVVCRPQEGKMDKQLGSVGTMHIYADTLNKIDKLTEEAEKSGDGDYTKELARIRREQVG